LAHRAGNHPVNGPAPYDGDILIKLNPNYDTVWTHSFTKATDAYSLEDISNMNLHGTEILVLSYCEHYHSATPYSFVYKINHANGIQNATYTNGSRAYNDILVDQSYLYLCGNEGSNVYYGNPYNDFGYQTFKKIDATNQVIWEKRFTNSAIRCLHQHQNNIYVYGMLGTDTLVTAGGNVNNLNTFIGKIGNSDIPTSVNEGSHTSSINFYPNPTTNTINISLAQSDIKGTFQITLRNTLGQIVLSKVIASDLKREEIILDISQLPKGNYFIDLETEKKVESKQLVIE
jgi:hypothetical protein